MLGGWLLGFRWVGFGFLVGVFFVLGGWTFGEFGFLVVGFCLLGGLVLVR